jgi:RND family efflux transporter MFP subunit
VSSERFYVGRPVARGSELVRLAPRASSDRTVGELETQMELASARLKRLEELLRLEAVSLAEVEEARARVKALATELEGSQGTSGEIRASVRAPFSGEVAEVHVVSGEAVSAGDPLLRIVRREPVWVEVQLPPRMAVSATQHPAGVVLRASGFEPITVDSSRTRFVSQSPEVNDVTGTVATIIEVRGEIPLPLGTAADTEILLRDAIHGVVIPASAIVDDGGIPVVYVQADGEGFVRQEVKIEVGQGDLVLVTGLPAGVRLVEHGGNAIRRAALMSTGAVEGHVH